MTSPPAGTAAAYLTTACASQHVAADMLDRFGYVPATEGRVLISDGARLAAVLEAVLARHQPHQHGADCIACAHCGCGWPCGEMRAIEAALTGAQGGAGQ